MIQSFGYTYDGAGNRREKRFEDNTAEIYGYDALNRLVSADYPNGRSVTYDYDAVGNRLQMNDSSAVTTYTYNAFNQLLTSTDGNGTTIFTYDANGNRIREAEAMSDAIYTWSLDDRLTVLTTTSGSGHSFEYDPDGLLVSRSAPADAVYERYLLDGIVVAKDLDLPGAELASYIYAPAPVDELLAVGTPARFHPTLDALGSPYGLIDSAEQFVSAREYDVFGQITSDPSSLPLTRFSFTGRELMANVPSGALQYHRARWYGAGTDVWLSPDPLGMIDGPNVYSYVRNAPTMRRDPSGLSSLGSAFVFGISCDVDFFREHAAELGLGATIATVDGASVLPGREFWYLVPGSVTTVGAIYQNFEWSRDLTLSPKVEVVCVCKPTGSGGEYAITPEPSPELQPVLLYKNAILDGAAYGVENVLLHEWQHYSLNSNISTRWTYFEAITGSVSVVIWPGDHWTHNFDEVVGTYAESYVNGVNIKSKPLLLY